jgi:hypothetical protein
MKLRAPFIPGSNRIAGFLPAAMALALSVVMAVAAEYRVSPGGDDGGSGRSEAPWKTLNHAVRQLKPGDTLLVDDGVYRESVSLTSGGTKDAPITIVAEEGARPVVTGADAFWGGWKKADLLPEVYVRDWDHVFRWNTWAPNDPPQLIHPDNERHRVVGRAEQVIHGGRLLQQVLKTEQLVRGTFLADVEAHQLYVCLSDGSDPNQGPIEASVRPTCFEVAPGVSHVHLRGLVFRYAANHAQRGAFWMGRPESVHHSAPSTDWVIEDCVFEKANGPGAGFTGERHTIRRCVFRDNGQLGFGACRCHDSVLSDAVIERNNTKGYDLGWEGGGNKVVLSRGFVFDGCTIRDNRGPGIWFDIGNEAGEVRNCFIEGNDEAGLYYEISFGLRAHDNLIVGNGRPHDNPFMRWGAGGILLASAQDCVIERNTIVANCDGFAVRDQIRDTDRIDGSTVRPLVDRNITVRGNVLAYNTGYNIGLWWDRPFFGPHPSGSDQSAAPEGNPSESGLLFADNVLCPLPGRANYLYGSTWRKGSRSFQKPEEFAGALGIKSSCHVASPGFVDPLRGDYRFKPQSAAEQFGAGARRR